MILPIVITTYDNGSGARTPLALNTIQGLLTNLAYPELYWILADDGSNQETHVAPLLALLEKHNQPCEASVVNRLGVGASKNTALQKAFSHAPVVLLLEDDWLLNTHLNIEPYVRLLTKDTSLGMVRFGYLGGGMEATFEGDALISYWRLKRGSGVYIYSGQVSLRHERFYKATGYHQEGISPGEEELEFCKRFNATDNAPDIVWPAAFACQFNTGAFLNIGMDHSLNNVEPA